MIKAKQLNNTQIWRRYETTDAVKIGIFGAMRTRIGDLLNGAVRFSDGANMIDGYYTIALEMPIWRTILGGING